MNRFQSQQLRKAVLNCRDGLCAWKSSPAVSSDQFPAFAFEMRELMPELPVQSPQDSEQNYAGWTIYPVIWYVSLKVMEHRYLVDPRTSRRLRDDLAAICGTAEPFEQLESGTMSSLWMDEECIGWTYQFLTEESRQRIKLSNDGKVPLDRVTDMTRVYTPSWIRKFLVHNSLGRLWSELHPDSRLAHTLSHFVRSVPKRRSNLGFGSRPLAAKEIKVFDPACGTMLFGLDVFDLLDKIYLEEIENAGREGWPLRPSVTGPSEIAASIVRNNIYGADLDPLAVELARHLLWIKASGSRNGGSRIPLERGGGRLRIENIRQYPASGQFGFLEREDREREDRAARFGSQKYHVILTNPPYIDLRDYSKPMRDFMSANYPRSKRNTYASFVERALELLTEEGRLGIVTPQTFMFIQTFSRFRQHLTSTAVLETLAHFGLDAFDGATVDTAAYVLRKESDPGARESQKCVCFRLVDERDKEGALASLIRGEKDGAGSKDAMNSKNGASSGVFETKQAGFQVIDKAPWVYWISGSTRRLFAELPPLKQIAEPRQGLATGDNSRFLRYWWEVGKENIGLGMQNREMAAESGYRWFPYVKGGDYNKWFGNHELVIDWANDGQNVREHPGSVVRNAGYYFREGVTWSFLSTKGFSARYTPPGRIFDVAGSTVFFRTHFEAMVILGILNSCLAARILEILNPTVNFQVGDIARIPIVPPDPGNVLHRWLHDLTVECTEIKRRFAAGDERSLYFIAPHHPDSPVCRDLERLRWLEREIDNLVFKIYGLEDSEVRAMLGNGGSSPRPGEITTTGEAQKNAVDWISYAVGVVLGRYRNERISSTCFQSAGYAIIEGNSSNPISKRNLAGLVHQVLEMILGPGPFYRLLKSLGKPLEVFLRDDFAKDHLRRFRNRPVYSILQDPRKCMTVYVHRPDASPELLAQIREELRVPGRGRDGVIDEFDALLKELNSSGAERNRTSAAREEF